MGSKPYEAEYSASLHKKCKKKQNQARGRLMSDRGNILSDFGKRQKNAKLAVFRDAHRGLKPLKFQCFVAILSLPRGKTL